MRTLRGLFGGCLALVVLGGTLSSSLAAEPEQPAQVVQRLTQAIGRMPTMPDQTNHTDGSKTPVAMLDIPGVSQQALGKHWETCSPGDKQRFVALFTQLLERVAFLKTAKLFQTLEIDVTDERVTGSQAVVSTTVHHPKGGLISIDYLLTRHGQTWRVRDVSLDGVSMVMNLRSQFQKVITESSLEALFHRMQKKLAGAPALTATTR